jgi:hypothetical protein
MKPLLTALSVLYLASVAQAQTIHQYPYDSSVTAYASPSAWPLLSAQCHWRPANSNPDGTQVPQLISPSLGHTHLEAHAPIYSEITGNFTIPFDLVLFHVDGSIINYASLFGPLLGQVTWDSPLPLIGNPTGVVTITGHVVVDLSKADGSNGVGVDVPKRGWFIVTLETRTNFTNGDRTDAALSIPFYSMLDPTKPEVELYGGGIKTTASCSPISTQDQALRLWGDQIGANFSEYRTYLPILAPILGAITAPTPFLYSYIADARMPNTIGMTRVDMDLHNGVAGTLIATDNAPPNQLVLLPSPFDPAILGAGVHKVAAIWQQDTGAGVPGVLTANEQVTSLLVVTVTVGTNTPPPPPPPTEVWTTWFLQHGDISGNLRACPNPSSSVGCVGVMKP